MKDQKTMTNVELRETFGAELATGQCLIAAHYDSSDDGATRVEFVQARNISNPNRPSRSRFQKEFSRSLPVINRAWMTLSDEDIEKGFALGDLRSDVILVVRDQIVEPYPNAVPRLTKEGMILVTEGGDPIYRVVSPFYTDENEQDHIITAIASETEWTPAEEHEA